MPTASSRTLDVGSSAPDFALPADDGSTVRLSDFRGRVVVLYFYPRDETPLCTAEACSFRDAFPRFTKSDAVVLGVSTDSVEKHRRFKEHHQLPFTLLSDRDHAVAEAYGTWREGLLGKLGLGMERTTFLIGRDGRVARIFRQVKAREHAAEVAEAIAAL
jgi:peroxiredoxin Q/BCP